MRRFLQASWQTKFFILNLLLYTAALLWTTVQAYARLDYSRSNVSKPLTIRVPNDAKKT